MILENLPEITTVRELAEFLKVSDQTIQRAITSGKLKAFKVSRDWRIERDSVLEWIDREDKEEKRQERLKKLPTLEEVKSELSRRASLKKEDENN